MKIVLKCTCAALSMAAALTATTVTAFAADTITFAGFGGTYQDQIVEALIGPATKANTVELAQANQDGVASVRAQVQSGSPAWDIVQMGAEECAAASKQGLLEPLDYNVVKTDGLPANAMDKDWVAPNYYSVFMAWRTDKFKNNPPQNWADFWNVEKFKGARALETYPSELLEVALLADGVDPANLYPLDVDRALKKIEAIKPNINVWWSSGSQSAQLLRDGEVDLMLIWGSRLAAVLADKAPVGYTYNQALINYSCLGIVKGSSHKDLAMKVIAAAISPDIQANVPVVMPFYGPTNENAYKVRQFSPEVLANANSSPENRAKAVMMDPRFWGENYAEIEPKLKAIIGQ